MGGQTSRMVREIMEDSAYIVRQTNRATYERSRAAHEEVQQKLQDLRRLNEETLQSAEHEAQRSEVYRTFQTNADERKKALDEQAESFVKQFEMPENYQKIADTHREERRKAQEALKAAQEEADAALPPIKNNQS